MDLSLFATQTVKQGPLSGSSSALFGNGSLADVGGLGNLNFLEAILGNLDADGEIKTTADNQNSKNDIAKEGIKKEAVDLTLLQLALLGQDVDKNLDEKLAELKIEKLAQTEENRVAQLTKLIDHLTSGLPQETEAFSGSTIEDLVSRLTKRLENLESSLGTFRTGNFNDDEAPFKLLIATGLNPAQLTKITNRIEEVEQRLGRELTVEDLIAGVGNIIPAPGDDDHEFSTTDALGIILKHSDNEDLTPQQKEEIKEREIAEEINISDQDAIDAALPIAGMVNNADLPFASQNIEVKNATKSAGIVKNYDTQALLNLIAANKIAPAGTPTNSLNPSNPDNTILPEDGITPLPQNMSNAEFKELFSSNNNVNITAKNTIANLVTSNITPDAAIPKLAFLGDVMPPLNWSESLLSQSALNDALGFDIQTGTPFTSTMQAAHAATAAQSAGQTHPGTQMVAAQINKAAQNGDTRQIVLQIDPPELGRVEIRMEFGADNAVKAHLIVEKPETYLMLQRDMAALEKALADAGLETGSDSLNYEMAEDNYGFGDDNKGQNGNSGTDNASHDGELIEEEIIQTTMNWNVDPTTGHVHYNILA